MTERPGDDQPPPPGGRAAERLRQFEASRGLTHEEEMEDEDEQTAEKGDKQSGLDDQVPED